MSCDHDLLGAEKVERISDRLQWIRIADDAFRLDPSSAETLERCGEAKACPSARLVDVGQPVAEARV
jgi:hypothetical protein